MTKARMIRKQVYIEPKHEELLRRKAEQWQVSEAEIIRHALDEMPDSPAPEPARLRAWDEIKRFVLEHRMMDVPQTGRQWTRDELYEDRLTRYGPDHSELPDPAAIWEQEKEFIRKHRMLDVPQTGRTWTREDLYQERMNRYAR